MRTVPGEKLTHKAFSKLSGAAGIAKLWKLHLDIDIDVNK